jgi:hypothetical protein
MSLIFQGGIQLMAARLRGESFSTRRRHYRRGPGWYCQSLNPSIPARHSWGTVFR